MSVNNTKLLSEKLQALADRVGLSFQNPALIAERAEQEMGVTRSHLLVLMSQRDGEAERYFKERYGYTLTLPGCDGL